MDIVKRYEELLKLDPGSIAFAPLAEELCYRGFWEGALKVCRQGLTHHPQHLRGRVLLGWALKELGESDEAEKVLEEAEGEIQKNALLFRLLAELAKKAGDTDRAERLLLIHQNLQPGTMERPPMVAVKVEAPPSAASLPEPPVISPPEPSAAPLTAISPESPVVITPSHQAVEPPTLTPPEPLAVSMAEPPAVSPPEPPDAPLPEPPVMSPKDEAADFLSSLLNRYEALPEKNAMEQQLFTEDDRRTLSRILKSLRH